MALGSRVPFLLPWADNRKGLVLVHRRHMRSFVDKTGGLLGVGLGPRYSVLRTKIFIGHHVVLHN